MAIALGMSRSAGMRASTARSAPGRAGCSRAQKRMVARQRTREQLPGLTACRARDGVGARTRAEALAALALLPRAIRQLRRRQPALAQPRHDESDERRRARSRCLCVGCCCHGRRRRT